MIKENDIEKYSNFLKNYKTINNEKIDDYYQFFNNYSFNSNEIIINNLSNIETTFNKFSKSYQILLNKKNTTNEIKAWDFSIFNIIKVKRPEENLHSPILKELLDTNGNHGQKDIFYKEFLKNISQNLLSKFTNSNYNDYYIKTEKFIRNEEETGKVDIFIQSNNPKNKFAVIIENKWDSPDSCPDQLYKYYKHFTKIHNFTDDNLLVIYLTKQGSDPVWIENKEFIKFLNENRNKNYFPISYQFHIKNWLNNCITACKSKKVKSTIEQYLKILI